ncbi:UNVERIFIED_CONTAM: hypothetical protein HDU68_001816 [Siphonaria sp. JEL0065]|nr:hypothetical protein HDU68_001816 [Siphonaria sp. JEL0065]
MTKGRVILVVGGARSGKSTFAEKLAVSAELPLLYIATAQRSDAEMIARIDQHLKDREDVDWTTVECSSSDLCSVDTSKHGVVLVDCLTLWLTNTMAECGWPSDENVDEKAVLWSKKVDDLARKQMREFLDLTTKTQKKTVVLVANEVGLSTCPNGKISRYFRDTNGRVLQDIARRSDCESVFFMVAGCALDIKKMSAQATLKRLGEEEEDEDEEDEKVVKKLKQ